MTEHLGDVLVAYRARAGLTQEELALRAGLSVRAVRDIERKRVRAPHARSLRRLSEVLGADLAAGGRPGGPLRVDVLGPLAVRRGDIAVEVGAPMQRKLLGLLALCANTVVTGDEIVDVLWPTAAPDGARSLMHTYIARLRKALGSAALVRVGAGYRLELASEQSDLLEFDRLVEAGAFGDALDLWRGRVLADVDELRQHPAAVAAAHRRIAAARRCADTGDADAALKRLWRVAHDEPLHEGLSARIMLALAATGERAAALRLFREVRTRLVETLGIEPGAELEDAYLAILRQRTEVRARVPAQLPHDVASFTGRERQLRALDDLLGADTVAAVVSGPAGVGKTALAVRWAHRVRDRFPDGQLVVDLRGDSGQPLTADDALTQVLRALGVAPSAVPFDLAGRTALFRSMTADLRLLLLVDGATRAEQVRPLIPAGPGCALVVTSRGGLPGLRVRDGALGVPLDILGESESVALLRALLDGADAGEDTLVELARLCARLPLALRIAAANITGLGPGAAADYADALATGNRLRELAVDGESAVHSAFELSYATLDAESARAFRALGLVPGVDVTSTGVAALLGCDQATAVRALDRLVAADLVQRGARDRYRFHDLLRLFAQQKGQSTDPARERDRTRLRLFQHYVVTADWAVEQLYPGMLRLTALPSGVTPDRSVDPARWLDVERTNLVAIVQAAAEHGPKEIAWQLADVLRGYLWRTHDLPTWLLVGQAGLGAARAVEDLRAVAAMEYVLGTAQRHVDVDVEGANRLATAAALFAALGDRRAEAAALDSLGVLLHEQGQSERAMQSLLSSVAICRAEDFTLGLTKVLCNLGLVAMVVTSPADACDHLAEALNLARAIGDRYLEATALHHFGRACRLNGDTGGALDTLRHALTLYESSGDSEGKAKTLDEIGSTLHDIGDPSAAHHWHEALAVYEKLEHRSTEDLRRRIALASGQDAAHSSR